VILRLEDLEGRDQPSGPGDLTAPAADLLAPPARQRPVIVSFRCQEISSGLFVITGRVQDQSPGGLTVRLGGSTSADGLSAVTREDGTFSLTVRLRVDGSDTGWITATAVDAEGLVSDPVSQFVSPTPP
jgi:hypothetical protein